MTTDWTPPAEAVEAAQREIRSALNRFFQPAQHVEEIAIDVTTAVHEATIEAVYRAIVAEKDAEADLVGGDYILGSVARAVAVQRDEALRKLAAVAVELERPFAMSAVNSDPHGAWREAVAYVKQALRIVLADHADTLANVKADAWDEGVRAEQDWQFERGRYNAGVIESPPIPVNPYRTTEGTDR